MVFQLDSFFFFLINPYLHFKQRTTTDSSGFTYMERGCAADCGTQTNSLYDSNVPGYRKTVTNICCQQDACNHSPQIKSNKAFVASFLLISATITIFK